VRKLDVVAAEAATCTRCELYECATQTVFGDGPSNADVIEIRVEVREREMTRRIGMRAFRIRQREHVRVHDRIAGLVEDDAGDGAAMRLVLSDGDACGQ